MPSLKMKTKSTTGCSKEKCFLRVCQKSNVISKSPLSCLRVSQNVEEIRSSNHNIQDDFINDTAAPVCEEAETPDLAGDKTNLDELSKEDKHFLKQPPNVTESAIKNTVEPPMSPCTSSTETVFSPILDSMDLSSGEGRDYFYIPQLDNEDSDNSSGSATELQVCNVTDFCVSDIVFSGASESNSIFDDRTDIIFEHDYKLEESSLLCNLSDECRTLPFLNDNIDARRYDDSILTEGTITNADNTNLYMAIHQLRSCKHESNMNACPDQDYEFFDPQSYIGNLPDYLDLAMSANLVPHEKQSTTQITLVLDLDETLVHSTLDPCDDADFTFTVFFDMKEHTVYVRQRPHLHTFLKKVAEMFEVVVFTASQSIYAKQLLDILDPDGMFISRRAYRESCIFSEGTYLKDLTVLGVDLAKVAIIDNSPQVYRLQVNNGIPIKSWFDDPSDSALVSLLPFLETLRDVDDVRPIIASKFGNKE